MLLLTNVRKDGKVDILIVLGDENIERIKQYDYAEVNWSQLPPEYSSRRPQIIGIGYATADEMVKIQNLSSEGRKAEAFGLVTRGWKYRPEKGDHDFGPTVLGKPTPGTKQ